MKKLLKLEYIIAVILFMLSSSACMANSTPIPINPPVQNTSAEIPSSPQQINVLCLDGGGVKSMISLMILQYIEEKTGKKISDSFDIIAGTSSGGVLSLYLTVPDPQNPTHSKFSTNDIIKIFETDSRKIFKPRAISRVVPTYLVQLVMPGYENKNAEKTFSDRFGDTKLSELVKKTIILSYDAEAAMPFVFKSYDSQTEHALVKDAAIATASAPFFFSPLAYSDGNHSVKKTLIDGGIISKNPSLIAYFELKKLYPNAQINMVSVGSGLQNKQIYNYTYMEKWGFVQYVVPMISFMLDGGVNTTDYQVSQLISQDNKSHYYRFQVPLNSKTDGSNNSINDVSEKNLDTLKKIAKKYIETHKDEINKMVEQIENNSQQMVVKQ